MSQSNCLQVNLYSNNSLQYSNLDAIKTFMESNYSYVCTQYDLKMANKKQTAPGKTSVLVVKNYIPDNMKDIIVTELDETIFNTDSSQTTSINEILNHSIPTLSNIVTTVEGVIRCAINSDAKWKEFDRFNVLRNDIRGTEYSNATMSIYVGEDNYPVEMKWFNKTSQKSEGRKTSFKLNKRDLFIVISDFDETSDYTVEIKTGSYVKTKQSAKQSAKKVIKATETVEEKQPSPKPVIAKVTAPVSNDKPKQKKNASNTTAIHRRITRKRPNGKFEKVWRKITYKLKDEETWLDSWKVNKTVYNTLEEAEASIGDTTTTNTTCSTEKKATNASATKNNKQTVKKSKPIETTVTVEQHPTMIPSPKQTSVDPLDDYDMVTDDLDDELIDVLDDIEDDYEEHKQDTGSSEVCLEEEYPEYDDGSNASTKSQSPVSSDTDDDDAEEIQSDDIASAKELVPDTYDEDEKDTTTSPRKDVDNVNEPTNVSHTSSCLMNDFSIENVVTIKMSLITIPKSVVLCDETGKNTETRKVFVMSSENSKHINIGNTHRIGNRIYGFETEYPVYNLITM